MHSRASRLPDNDWHVGTAPHIVVVQEIVCVKRRHRIVLIIGCWEGWSCIAVVAAATTTVVAAAIPLEWRRWFCFVSGTLEIVIDAFDVVVIAVLHPIRCLAIVLGPHLTILVVIVAQYLIITQIESVANAESNGEIEQIHYLPSGWFRRSPIIAWDAHTDLWLHCWHAKHSKW